MQQPEYVYVVWSPNQCRVSEAVCSMLCRQQATKLVKELRDYTVARPRKTTDLYWRLQEQILVGDGWAQ